MKRILFLLITLFLLNGCHDRPLNNPYPHKENQANILYSSFSERPKTLDPARSYSVEESLFTNHIYEPPLQYDYLQRPYQLIPLTATTMPQPQYVDKSGNPLPQNAADEKIAYSIYRIQIKPGIFFQNHPAFAKDSFGNYRYQHLTLPQLEKINTLSDFTHTATRELTAEDYVYQIKRLANPKVHSPILGLMSQHIVGLKEYSQRLSEALQKHPDQFLDLRQYPLAGVKVIDRYTYEIKLTGKYPQFIYWLAMPFFAAMPWEADLFYANPALKEHNISLDWYPVGTGPYQLVINNPNKEMVLVRNANFHPEFYPQSGTTEDKQRGLLKNAGLRLPFIDKIVFTLEKESIPRWNKFLQGYYDSSDVSSDSFDQAIRIDQTGTPHLTAELSAKGVQLQTQTGLSTFYLGFNMNDDVVGGMSERARKLRQAISIALDYEDFISIFLNGRGLAAQGPLPPGIFGYQQHQHAFNPYVYDWVENKPQRKSLAEAKKLLTAAGYPHGINPKTGKPLILHYDTVASGGPDDKSRLDWMRKQFEKLGIQLNIRSTTYNRFQEKVRQGNAQLFSWGWMADYPDPENFLFLLYGPNGKVKHGGENAVNYHNPEYDRLFDKMKNLPNNQERQRIIEKMIAIVQRDAPWAFGFHPLNFALSHQWGDAVKLSAMSSNTLKYKRIYPEVRELKRQQWNQPIWWPIFLIVIILMIALLPVLWHYWRKEHQVKRRKPW
ncbi:MAG: ABC transporter substrate-binding protein [Legionellales bacterium]|nr:ABC transporter substrate-binding protein [Legionellales bacterium]